MHNGQIMELASADDIYDRPLHPYTQSLLSAVPQPDPKLERKQRRVAYDASIEANNEGRQLREVAPAHFVYATEAEVPGYQAALAKMTQATTIAQ